METIVVYCIYNDKRFRITVDSNANIQALESSLRKRLQIPNNYKMKRINGTPSRPSVIPDDEFEFYDTYEQVIHIIKDNQDTHICLYGCPTSKDRPGIVPSCMLTSFDGFVLSEV